ncbi:MAG: hypothetical protein HDT41_06505 [Lachnospiraceae bacterium]|nr:hypothetical protein [Lachnospiraceae bacterium]
MGEVIAENIQTLNGQDFLELFGVFWEWNRKKRKKANVSLIVFGIVGILSCVTSFIADWRFLVKLAIMAYVVFIIYVFYAVNRHDSEKWAGKLLQNYKKAHEENEDRTIFYTDRIEKKTQGKQRIIEYRKIVQIQSTENLLVFIMEDDADGITQMGVVRKDGFKQGSAEKVLEAVKGIK